MKIRIKNEQYILYVTKQIPETIILLRLPNGMLQTASRLTDGYLLVYNSNLFVFDSGLLVYNSGLLAHKL